MRWINSILLCNIIGTFSKLRAADFLTNPKKSEIKEWAAEREKARIVSVWVHTVQKFLGYAVK